MTTILTSEGEEITGTSHRNPGYRGILNNFDRSIINMIATCFELPIYVIHGFNEYNMIEEVKVL